MQFSILWGAIKIVWNRENFVFSHWYGWSFRLCCSWPVDNWARKIWFQRKPGRNPSYILVKSTVSEYVDMKRKPITKKLNEKVFSSIRVFGEYCILTLHRIETFDVELKYESMDRSDAEGSWRYKQISK